MMLVVKNPLANAGDVRDVGSISGLEKSPGGRLGNPLQYSCLENPHGQRSLASYSPWSHKELDMTDQLSTHMYTVPLTLPILPFSSALSLSPLKLILTTVTR